MTLCAQNYDYVIIGAGPGGVQLGYYLQKRGASYVILERGGAAGAFFSRYPRHRKLISINKVHTGFDDPEINLRWDWNSLLADSGKRFTSYSDRYFPPADDFVSYLGDFVKEHKINVQFSTTVEKVTRPEPNGDFQIDLGSGDCVSADKLIVASGRSLPKVPNIPGIEHCEFYRDISTDPDDYTGQRIT